MNHAVINVKTDPKLKRDAQKVAKQLGLSLSSVVNAQLKELVRTKSITLSVYSEKPSPYLIKLLEESEKDVAKGFVSPRFNTADDAIAWLNDPKARYENGTRADV